MDIHSNTLAGNQPTVAQIAVAHPKAVSVFTKYNIDFCCGGHRTLEEACLRVGLNPDQIKTEIFSNAPVQSSQSLRVDQWSSSLLADYIVQNHHGYVRQAIPEIKMFLDKVCDAHGQDCTELLAIRENFHDLADELTQHMEKEEVILFPALKRLESHNNDAHPLTETIQSPIAAMEHEHNVAGDLTKSIRTYANNYTPPDFACPTFRVTYQKLQEFDSDLMVHIHLENNILFERVKNTHAGRSCSF